MDPRARARVHSPTASLFGAVDAPQGKASLLQDDAPLGLKPILHVSWQVAPDAKLEVQSPTAPLFGAINAQGFAYHFAAVKAPALQDDAPLGL